MKKKIITICSSASFYKEVFDYKKGLESLGFKVLIPKTAYTMKRNNNFNVSFYKTWHKNKEDYKKKTALMQGHFKKVLQADAILVLNLEKKGVKGYIGGNALMEMTLAFHYKKPIYILNNIPKDLGITEEIFGLNPIFIQNDLKRIKK